MVQKLWLRNTEKFIFSVWDLNFDLRTLVLKLELDTMIYCAQNEVRRSLGSKIIIWKRRHA